MGTVPKITVLLADDSGFMRLVLTDMLGADQGITIVGTAENGREAYEKTRSLQPDVVLLDLIMPEYDGLYAVKQIMQDCPRPIVVLSALGNSQSEVVFEALDAGAYDFLAKPAGVLGSKIREIEAQLIAKIKTAASVDLRALFRVQKRHNTHSHTFESHLAYQIVAIGASTGGTGVIEEILQKIPENFPIPIVIAQHMPPGFVESFARRLNAALPLTVRVGRNGEALANGVVYIVPGDQNTLVKREAAGGKVRFESTSRQFPEYNGPSVDCLMQSVAEVYGQQAIGVILTGMGKDGAAGMTSLYQKGAFTIAQDEKTSVVFGMPKAAISRGVIRQILPASEIPGFVVSCLS